MTHYTKLKNHLRKSKTVIATVVLLFTAHQLNAQAPGYMGQRFLVGGYVSVAPALFNYNANMKQSFISFNFRKTIEVEYVASRRVAIGLHYDFINVGTQNEYLNESEDIAMRPTPTEDQKFQCVLSRAPGIQIKLFKTESKGALAPLGNYFAWNFSLVKYTVWNLKKDDYSTLTRQVFESDGSKFLIGMEWGSQKIYFDRVVLRTGFQLSLLTGFGGESPEKDYMAAQRIAYAASFNIGLSLIVPYHQKVN
ncbi:MAG: hypothetical protein ABI723_16245 [Bacteroidia bacterium]